MNGSIRKDEKGEAAESAVWRFLRTGDRSPAENMAIDEAIMSAHRQGCVPPTLRFYGWRIPTISIGYFQQADKEIDLPALEQAGLGFVRRPTGGRTVLHSAELTYSIIVREDFPGIPTDTSASFRYLSAGLREGLRLLRLHPREEGDALRTRSVDSASEQPGRAGAERAPSACFAAPAREEISIDGKKAVGSAQWKSQGVILQHGSIPLELDGDTLFRALRFENESARMLARRRFQAKAAAINDILRGNGLQPVSLPDLERAFGEGFQATLSDAWIESELTASEADKARELVNEKYGTNSWNQRAIKSAQDQDLALCLDVSEKEIKK